MLITLRAQRVKTAKRLHDLEIIENCCYIKPELIMQWDRVLLQSYLLRGLQEQKEMKVRENMWKIITLVKQFRSCKSLDPLWTPL